MTQEEKDLLLKDLCTRLLYGVKIYAKYIDTDTNVEVDKVGVLSMVDNDAVIGFTCDDNWCNYVTIHEVKPYLFPLSSMSEEQKKEFIQHSDYEVRDEDCGRHKELYYYDVVGHEDNLYPNYDSIDWLNKNHFDYRGLIEKGLAIDATNKNIY